MSGRHGGAEHIKAALGREKTPRAASPLGVAVADLLGEWAGGLYHLDGAALMRADWSNPRWIRVVVGVSPSTCDRNDLTRLVFLAHHLCLRVEVGAAAPRYLELFFHPRRRDGSLSGGHPTLAEAVTVFQDNVSLPERDGAEYFVPAAYSETIHS